MSASVRSFHKANKHPLGEWLVGRVLMQGALARAFGGTYARIHPATLRLRHQPHLPLIFCATHSGWWDGHMAYILNKRIFHRDAYLMMEEAQLTRYAFFTWVGAFGVDRQDPRSALESVKYISAILAERPNKALWIFPQGEMYHPDARPIVIQGGATNIAGRLGECALVPVALRYDFLREQAPVAFANIGPPLMVGSGEVGNNLSTSLAAALTSAADDLHQNVTLHNTEDYLRVLSGRSSANRNWDRVKKLVTRGR